MSTNPLYFIGGLVGKGVFASAIVSLVYTLSGKRSKAKRGFLKMLEGWLKSAMEVGAKAIGKLIGDICGFILMQFLKMSMTESVQRAGREAFDSALREGIKYSGGHITRELINTAQWAKAAAKAERIEFLMYTAIESSKNLSDATAKYVGDCLKSGKVDYLFALLLNYSVGGKESDNEALGGNTADVIYGFFQDRFVLKVSQVLNTLANPIAIRRNLTAVKNRDSEGKALVGKHMVIGSTKTDGSADVIPVNTTAITILKQMLEKEPKGYNGYIAHNDDYSHLGETALRKRFSNLLRQAKVESCGIHSLRHTFASKLYEISKGDSKLVSSLVRHSSVSFTEDTYIHLKQKYQQKSIADFSI